MTKLERALQLEQEELQLTPNRERVDVILDPKRLINTTCPSFYGFLDYECYKGKCKDYYQCNKDWNEEI